ncbi:unnamed protein product [Caenorhabditis sp. 36 PRJEB53466]|nr:unnamed protein product [Caenorhabditis sp. 36 PRJEB53466]
MSPVRHCFLLILALILVAGGHAFTLYRANKPNHRSGSDSRNKSENVDLDETDNGSFDRLKNVLSNLNPSVGLMHAVRLYRE